MTPEQKEKAVVLDAAQEMQHNDKWWREFEWMADCNWFVCSEHINPIMNNTDGCFQFRRRPKAITVTMPMPTRTSVNRITQKHVYLSFLNEADCDTALAAIRAEMENTK